MRRYLDDWLVQSSSRESLLRNLRVVLDLCHELGIVVNPAKSHLVPSQVVQYLGVVVDSQSFRASPSPEHVAKLRSTANAFLLRRSSSEYLALAARLTVLSLPSRSWRPPPCEVSPAVSPPGLGSGGPVSQDSLDSSLPPGSSVVVRPSPSVSSSGVSGSGLLVRCLRRGLGSSSGFSHRFRPLGCRASRSVHQRSRASGHQGGSPPLPLFSGREECGGILRQLHSSVVSPQGGGHTVAVPQLPGSGDSPLDGVPLHPTVTPVHSGVSERSGGLSLSPSPTPSYRVVSSSRGFSVYQSHVASPIRLICNISKSPMLSLFLSIPGSVGGGHRRLPPTLGRASGLRVSSVVCNPSSSCEAQDVSGDGTHPDSSLLASANLVSRPPSPVAGPSGRSASTSQPPAPASVSRPLPGSPQASSSWLETLRRFTRAAGFSSAVASQASLSRRPSSRKAYQLSGRSTVPGATLTGILSPVQHCLRWQNFFAGSAPRRIWEFLPSGATAPCCLRFLGSSSPLSLLILCFGIIFALSALSRPSASFALQLGTSPWF